MTTALILYALPGAILVAADLAERRLGTGALMPAPVIAALALLWPLLGLLFIAVLLIEARRP